MPKTNLYPTPRPDQPKGADTRIEIGWHQHGWVQLATTKLQPGADRDLDYVQQASPDDPLVRAWDGWFIDLDRYQINQLIRFLREARDKAFGRDE
jgi:hypothetical protein